MLLGSTEERPKSSRGRRPADQEPASSQSPPASPEHQPAVRGDKVSDKIVSPPPGSPEVKPDGSGEDVGSPQGTPRSRGKGTFAGN